MTNYLHSIRRFNQDVYLVLIALGLITFGYFGVQAVLLNLYLLRLGYRPEFIGILNGMGTLILVVVALPAGLLGARWGLRKAMVAGIALSVLGSSMILLVEYLP
jgi:MFS family permease